MAIVFCLPHRYIAFSLTTNKDNSSANTGEFFMEVTALSRPCGPDHRTLAGYHLPNGKPVVGKPIRYKGKTYTTWISCTGFFVTHKKFTIKRREEFEPKEAQTAIQKQILNGYFQDVLLAVTEHYAKFYLK